VNLLAAHHLQELVEGSGIPPELIDQEHIQTITTRAEAARHGYTEGWQQLAPAIVFPVRPPDGSNSLYVIKPDQPRPRKDKPGKFIKYEWPHGRPHRLDVVGDLADLTNPEVDLYVVEGKKKALALLAHMRRLDRRCVIIVVWGVWAWGKKRDEHSRPDLLGDWDLIVLDGRRVFIVFDSDREDKENVDLAARWCADRLGERGAEVYHVILPGEPDGSKNGIDDLIVRHGFDAFERCVETALDCGPHGAEALRAAWRRQRAELRELKRQLSEQAALLRNPAMRERDKLVAIATINEAGWRKSTGTPTPFVVNRWRIADAVGLRPNAIGQSLDRLSADNGLFVKQVARTNNEHGEPRSVIKLTPRYADASELRREAAHYAPTYKGERGGTRPTCPDHPNAQVLRRETLLHFECGCVIDERVALKVQNETSVPLLRFNSPETKPAHIVAETLRTAFPDARTAVDLTPGDGNFWSESEPVHVQVERSPHDFCHLPYADASIDVALIDPPHNADCGADSIMGERYGTYTQAELEQVIRQGVAEAWRVARLGVIVKVTEQIHAQVFQAERDWVREAIDMPIYDVTNGLHTPLRREARFSVLNNGSTYLVFRKGDQRHTARFLKVQNETSEKLSLELESVRTPTLRTYVPQNEVSGQCPGCGEVWRPHKGSTATVCGMCSFYGRAAAS
jgi:hypothetical protein